MAVVQDVQKGELLGGLYQIGGLLGKGAFSHVYKALNVRTGETVAVKQFSTRNIPQKEVDTMMAEAELMKRLEHPNIVGFQGYIKQEKTLSFVIEYVENGSVTSLIKNFGSLPEVLARVYVQQVLLGLRYLHEQGIIHRDIKGCNILIAKDGTVKLADFGVSALMSEQDKHFSVVGTPYWMAPEVIEMTGHHTVSDIWSLGCTVIELLTGSPPYFDLQSMAALFRIVQDPHPPLPPNISPTLKQFLLRCFTKDPSKRPTAEKLLKHSWITSASVYGPAPMPLQGSPKVGARGSSPVESPVGPASDESVAEIARLKKELRSVSNQRDRLQDEVNDLTIKLLVAVTEKQDAIRIAEEALQSSSAEQRAALQKRTRDLNDSSSLVLSSYEPLQQQQQQQLTSSSSSSASSSHLTTAEQDALADFNYSKEYIQQNKRRLAAEIKFSWKQT